MKTIISAEVHKAINKELKKIAEKTEKSKSQVIRDALAVFINRYDIEVNEHVQKILDQHDTYDDVDGLDYFIGKENYKISVRTKENTFIQYMNQGLANVYLSNKADLSTERTKELMRDTLEAMKMRAEEHGFEKEWQDRYEHPIEYTEEYLDRKTAENRAFGDTELGSYYK